MKVLISAAVWGKGYCSTFTGLSLASLLSPNNLPRLSGQATTTFHIVTTRKDRRQLLCDRVFTELMRVCTIEWELLEDYGVYQPPTGAGGEKYPFLSALQNLAITRSLDHDVVIFDYADFIWADGSLATVVEMLRDAEDQPDAVFGFCMPVDRKTGADALQRYRRAGEVAVIDMSPRNAAKLVVENMHREARNRFWDAHRFTNLPTYIVWKVPDQGVVLRAYHQSILAMRVRPDDPHYREGIIRGSLDASLTAQLAKSGRVICANDTENVLVFSLYNTPVDSRLPPGETREISLQSVLRADVIPEQRRFAEYPYFFRLRAGDEQLWQRAAEQSWRVLERAQAVTAFDQARYDANYETHGVIPKLSRKNVFQRRASFAFQLASNMRRTFSKPMISLRVRSVTIRKILDILTHPSRLRQARRLRQFWNYVDRSKLLRSILSDQFASSSMEAMQVDGRLSFLRRILRLIRFLIAIPKIALRAVMRAWAYWDGYELIPNLRIRIETSRSLDAALIVEGTANRAVSDAEFSAGLRQAEALLRDLIHQVPVWPVPRRALGRNLWFQGRFEEALQSIDAAEKMRDVMAWIAGCPSDACIYLPRNCAESIGLMGHIDAFAKHKILTDDPRPYNLLAPDDKVINPSFLGYWREYINIISKPQEITRLIQQERLYGVDWNWAIPQGGKTVFVHPAMAAIQRKWQVDGRPPLLRLSTAHAENLSLARWKWGMEESDKFVCLHVRSSGFYGESREHAQRFRNTSLEAYYPLIRALAEMGFWVFRMGDTRMQPLDLAQCGSSGRVIDYALSVDRSSELDVALCAQCELFVSSPSGLHTVAHAFGRPVCEVNFPIYAGFPWHPDDIFAPQLYYSKVKKRVLSLREILGEKIVHFDHHFLLERAGITLLPLETDDLIETVREALSPSTYRTSDDALADRVLREFDNLNRHYHIGTSGRLGRYYAVKYATKLLHE